MLTDLRVINKVIQPIGSVEPGMSLPSLLPKEWPIIVTDLKYCLFTILLQEKDREKFPY